MNFKHIIITRFSIFAKAWNKKIDNNDEYLRYRLNLFYKFCMPSIQSQSSRNFIWFVLFGGDTTEWLCMLAHKWERDNIMKPIYIPRGKDAIQPIKDWINANMRQGEVIISTRLDNDDGLAVDYVHNVQKYIPDAIQCFEEWKNKKLSGYYYVEPVRGQQVVVHSDDAKEWTFHPAYSKFNPFISMIEPFSTNPLLIHWRQHNKLFTRGSIVRQIDSIMWLQVIHGRNLINRRGSKKIRPPDLCAFPWLSRYITISGQ